MTLQERIEAAEGSTSAALVPWLVRSVAVNVKDGGGAAHAAEMAGAPAGIVQGIKAAVGATPGGSPLLGGNSAAVTAFAEQTGRTSAFFAMHASRTFQRIPFETSLITFGVDISAAMVGEGEPIPLAMLDFDQTNLTRQKAGVIVALSNAAWRDVSGAGQSFVNEALRRAVGKVADTRMFAALTNSGTPDQAATTSAELQTFLGEALDYARVTADARPYIVMSPVADNYLRTLALTEPGFDTAGGRFMGFPSGITDALAPGQMAVIDGAAVAADVDAFEVKASTQANLQMVTDPETGATSSVSMFQTNSTAVRITVEYGLEPVRENAMALITVPGGS